MMNIKEYVANKKNDIKTELQNIEILPKLVIVQVNEDVASSAYVKGKIKDMNELGIGVELMKLGILTSQKDLLKVIEKLNIDDSVTGYIVQMPLPKGIDEELIKRSVNPLKDVDGFNVLSKFDPATPKGILTYLEDNNFEFKSKNAVIIGRSNIVGKPMHNLLLDKDMNVTIVHSKTKKEDMKFYIEHADLIIVAVGKMHFLTNEYIFKKDCVVMDVGISRDENNHLSGDCVPDLNVGYLSPVPGGVGLLTRLALTLNLMEAYRNGI